MQQQPFTWKTIPTRQFKEIISTLEDAKNKSKTAMIIAPTGLGKTYAVETYCGKNSAHTYRIVVSDLYRKEDIINELSLLLGLDQPGVSNNFKRRNVKDRLDAIAAELIRLKKAGHLPQVIFDEGENMKITPLKMIKALYDAIKDRCSLVLIGTDQLLNNMYINKGKRNRNSLPQLYSRFKAGLKHITPLDKNNDFEPFFKLYGVPAGLQTLLKNLSDSYRDFNDYLEPTIIEAKEAGKPLTEEFFRIKFNLSKGTKAA